MEKSKCINEMFASIADRYDLLNTLLSFNQDKYWRRFAVSKSGLKSKGSAIDVATGTGELAIELVKSAEGSTAIGVDFCGEMLEKARIKVLGKEYEDRVRFTAGMAENLPFLENTFDCALIGFALRNVADLSKTLEEMRRVVKPDGRVIAIEFTIPRGRVFNPLYRFYLTRILPVVGGLISGRRDAYTYFPNSVMNFPSREKLKEAMKRAGLHDVKICELTGGIVGVYIGTK